jgi:hypothetical protein
MSLRKLQFQRYANLKNGHLLKVNSHYLYRYSGIASLELEFFLSDITFSYKHYLSYKTTKP